MSSDNHLTLDELAELDEGLLAPERELDARSHLDGCAACRAAADRITRTRTALAGVAPAAMPDDVAARLDLALAAAAESPAIGSTAAELSANVVPDLGAVRNRRRLPSAPTAAAAAVVILAVAAIVIGVRGKSDNSANNTASSSGSSVQQQPLVVPTPSGVTQASFALTTTGRTYTAANIESLVPHLVKGEAPGSPLGPNLAPAPASTSNSAGLGSTGGRSGPTRNGTEPSSKSPHRHHKGSKSSKTGAFSAAGEAPASVSGAPEAAVGLPKVLQPYRESRRLLLQCAAFATNTPGAIPEAVDLGRWSDPVNHRHNVPALIMVFADSVRPAIDDVYVVAPPCGSADVLTLQTVTASH